jgi:hypothetical protein
MLGAAPRRPFLRLVTAEQTGEEVFVRASGQLARQTPDGSGAQARHPPCLRQPIRSGGGWLRCIA